MEQHEFDALTSLAFNIGGFDCTRSWINRNLAGTEKKIARADSLGIRTDGGWCVWCGDDLHEDQFKVLSGNDRIYGMRS